MKNFVKILFGASAVLLLPVIAFAAFPDVNESNTYYDAVNFVQTKGIVQGYPSGLFLPDMYINRAEFVKILVGTEFSMEEIMSCKDASFKDVPADAWYAPYVCIANKNDIIGGYPDGSFKGDGYINFVEAAKILVNTLKPGELAGRSNAGEWFTPFVDVMESVNAIPADVSSVNMEINRGLTAEMIYRLKNNITDKSSLTADEIGDKQLIARYYEKVQSKDFATAYDMKTDPGMSLEAFKSLYGDSIEYSIYDFKKTGAHTYLFHVMASQMFNANLPVGEPAELYLTQMEVVGGKLKTLSAEKLENAVLEEVSFSAGLTATIEWENGYYKVFTLKDGVKRLVMEEMNSSKNYVRIRNLFFSPQGNYLMFQYYGWEFGGVFLYDIGNGVLSEKSYQGIQVYGMTDDEKYFYVCTESGMGSGAAFVMDMPGFKLKRDVQQGKAIETCGPYDKATNTLSYRLYDDAAGMTKSYEYDVYKDEVKSL